MKKTLRVISKKKTKGYSKNSLEIKGCTIRYETEQEEEKELKNTKVTLTKQ